MGVLLRISGQVLRVLPNSVEQFVRRKLGFVARVHFTGVGKCKQTAQCQATRNGDRVGALSEKNEAAKAMCKAENLVCLVRVRLDLGIVLCASHLLENVVHRAS